MRSPLQHFDSCEGKPVPRALLIQHKLDHFVTGSNEEFVLVVKDHARRDTLWLENFQIAAVGIEDLNAFKVAYIDMTFTVDSNRGGGAELSRLVTRAAKPIRKFPIRSELKDRIVESPQGVNVAQPIGSDTRVEF